LAGEVLKGGLGEVVRVVKGLFLHVLGLELDFAGLFGDGGPGLSDFNVEFSFHEEDDRWGLMMTFHHFLMVAFDLGGAAGSHVFRE
jgi:hypothetical protein